MDGKASENKGTFRMDCSVGVNIKASPEKVWSILADGENYTKWNSTVTSFDGKLALGEKIHLKVKLDPKSTFSPKVTAFVPNRKLVFSDGMAPMFKGVRTYTLDGKPDGSTDVSVVEVFSGIMLPVIARSLPDFKPAFEQFAADLKKEAEK